MATIEHSDEVEIDAPREDVWLLRIDFSRLSDYNPSVRGVRKLDPEPSPGVGAVYEFELDSDYGKVECQLRVLDAQFPEWIVNEMDAGLHAVERCELRSIGGGATVMAIELAISVPDDLDDETTALIRRVNANQIRTELVNLKAMLEGDRRS